MFSSILSFIKGKLFSNSGILILIFLSIISLFIFSNTDVILSKLGFETTSNLKAELVRSQLETKRLHEINVNLNNTIHNLQEKHKQIEKILVSDFKKQEKLNKEINAIKIKKDTSDNKVVAIINDKTVITPNTITMPIEEYNKLSESNILTMHEVFNLLFNNEKQTNMIFDNKEHIKIVFNDEEYRNV